MAEAPEEPSRGQSRHRLGEALDELSIAELEIRIAELRAEIMRLEAMRAHKQGARASADTLFKT